MRLTVHTLCVFSIVLAPTNVPSDSKTGAVHSKIHDIVLEALLFLSPQTVTNLVLSTN